MYKVKEWSRIITFTHRHTHTWVSTHKQTGIYTYKNGIHINKLFPFSIVLLLIPLVRLGQWGRTCSHLLVTGATSTLIYEQSGFLSWFSASKLSTTRYRDIITCGSLRLPYHLLEQADVRFSEEKKQSHPFKQQQEQQRGCPRTAAEADWSQEERLPDVGLGELGLCGLEIRRYQELGATTSGQ